MYSFTDSCESVGSAMSSVICPCGVMVVRCVANLGKLFFTHKKKFARILTIE